MLINEQKKRKEKSIIKNSHEKIDEVSSINEIEIDKNR